MQSTFETLLLVETAKGPVVFKEDEWEQAKERGATGKVKRDRKVEIPEVFQYMTNGLEILDKVPWDGTRIPIIACLGPERWTTEGGKPKRQLLSMVRFARDPQMLYDYLASGECEVAGKIPKTPFVGAVGQFETDKEAWTEVTKVPHAFRAVRPGARCGRASSSAAELRRFHSELSGMGSRQRCRRTFDSSRDGRHSTSRCRAKTKPEVRRGD